MTYDEDDLERQLVSLAHDDSAPERTASCAHIGCFARSVGSSGVSTCDSL